MIGWQFARWVHGLEAGQVVGARPPGVEGFLPIAALLSLRHLFTTGEVHPVHPAGLVILVLILLMGFLAKKAFCSWACPVGTVSEALASVGRRLFRRTLSLPRWLDLPLRSLKYLLLLFFAHAIFVTMTGTDVADFLDSPYNRVADVKMLYFFERLSPFALKVLIGLGVASVVIPYSWCRYLCPYGALLGFVSLFSPLKVTRDAASCIDCSLCTKACPSRLPVERLARVSSDECVGCLSCVAACPVHPGAAGRDPRALAPRGPAGGVCRPRRRALRGRGAPRPGDRHLAQRDQRRGVRPPHPDDRLAGLRPRQGARPLPRGVGGGGGGAPPLAAIRGPPPPRAEPARARLRRPWAAGRRGR